MVQVIKVAKNNTGNKEVPEFLKKPVSGEEALARALQYDKKMKLIAEGESPLSDCDVRPKI